MDYIPSNHPLTPPHTAEDKSVWLRLLRSRRVGVSTFHRLMQEHGSASEALAALPDIARAAGVSDYKICPEGVVASELKAGRKAGAQLVALGEPAYPSALALIPDAPPLLWIKGDISLLERPMITLTGARTPSSLGLRMTRALARDLAAEGFGIASGLAQGIDAMAHDTSLASGTIAVMAGGIDIIDPIENKILYDKIASSGVLISEQPMGAAPYVRHYAQRSRILSGLSLATVITEAAAKSRAIPTAHSAMEQGREVMAVPGHPFEGRASGCNNLLRDGAGLIRGARDIIEILANASPLASFEEAEHDQEPFETEDMAHQDMALQTESAATDLPEPTPRDFADHTALHALILGRLGPKPMSEDQLIRDIGARADQVSSELVALELDGKVTRRSGGLLALA